MKVSPYYTIIPDYGDERDVCHDDNACPDGGRIKPEHKASGKNGRPLCKECAKL